MLYFNQIFDFEEKLKRINEMTYEQSFEAIEKMFDEKQKAIALVGNTDKPFAL